MEKCEYWLKYYLIGIFIGRFSLHSKFLQASFFTFGFFTGWDFLYPDFIRARMPGRGNEPDEMDESSPNRQVICNNWLGLILIDY